MRLFSEEKFQKGTPSLFENLSAWTKKRLANLKGLFSFSVPCGSMWLYAEISRLSSILYDFFPNFLKLPSIFGKNEPFWKNIGPFEFFSTMTLFVEFSYGKKWKYICEVLSSNLWVFEVFYQWKPFSEHWDDIFGFFLWHLWFFLGSVRLMSNFSIPVVKTCFFRQNTIFFYNSRHQLFSQKWFHRRIF